MKQMRKLFLTRNLKIISSQQMIQLIFDADDCIHRTFFGELSFFRAKSALNDLESTLDRKNYIVEDILNKKIN